MKILYSIIIAILILSCYSSQSDSNKLVYSSTSRVTEPDSVIGCWRFVNNRIIFSEWDYVYDDDEAMSEWTYSYVEDRSHIFFTEDSCFRIDYPLELFERGKYEIDSFYFNVEGTLGKSRYYVKDDTMILYRYDDGNFMKETFKRIHYSDSIFKIIKKDTVNYPALEGTWYLQREYNAGNDGSFCTLNYPYDIPDSITLSRDYILKNQYNGRSFYMKTDGQKRLYTFYFNRKYNSEPYWGGKFYLEPGEWYKGEEVILEYLPHYHKFEDQLSRIRKIH